MSTSGHGDYLSAPGVLAFAHRGDSRGHTENSLEALTSAIVKGYRYLEIDVRASSDGVAYVFHDDGTERLLGRQGRFRQLTSREVDACRYAGGEGVARLDETLHALDSARFSIDFKDWGVVPAAAQAILRTNSAARVCVSSFSDRRIRAGLRLLGPRCAAGVGVQGLTIMSAAGPGRRRLPHLIGLADRQVVQLPAVYLNHSIGRRYMAYFRRLGLSVHLWTLNSRAEIRAAVSAGADGIISDELDVLREELTDLGAWGG